VLLQVKLDAFVVDPQREAGLPQPPQLPLLRQPLFDPHPHHTGDCLQEIAQVAQELLLGPPLPTVPNTSYPAADNPANVLDIGGSEARAPRPLVDRYQAGDLTPEPQRRHEHRALPQGDHLGMILGHSCRIAGLDMLRLAVRQRPMTDRRLRDFD